MQDIHFLLKDLEQEKKEKKMEKQKYFEEDEYAKRYTSGDDDDDDVDEGDQVDEKEEEESSDGEQENESENEEKEEKNEANQEEASTSINDTKELNRHPLEPLENTALEIHHFSHYHPLKIFQLAESSKYGNCNACAEELRYTIYICQYCEDYGLHKACTELPYELKHPLHSQHSLILFSDFPYSESTWFLCDECGDFSAGFVYLCTDCLFKLDVKCAVFAAPKSGSQDPKHRKKETKLLHFSHEHALVLGNLVHISISCFGCNLPISGPAYCCLDCVFIYAIHESCFRILPKEVHHPFHPLHHLVALSDGYERKCHACKLNFRYDFSWEQKFIRYGCLQCKLDLHFVCANSLRRVLKSNSHTHNLHYFGPDSQMFLERFRNRHFNFLCSKCSEMCKGPFYRCVECATNFHLNCVPIPQRIKSKCHLHHLTLKDSFIEDDIGEYYCDVCEEERHPKDHIYYCEECHGFFVAHIECVLSMDFEQVVYFDEDEKNDDDNDHEEGNEAGEGKETSSEITAISKLES